MLIAGFCYDSKFMFYDNIKYKMNHDVKIRENNLIINVKNTGKNSYRFNSFNYKLGGDYSATPRDEELAEVKPGEKKKWYIYFKKTDKTIMSYQKTGGKEYQFNIK